MLIKDFFQAFTAGKELANGAAWKDAQLVGSKLAILLGALLAIANAFGYFPQVTTQDALLLALSLFLSGCSTAPLQLSQQQKLACAVFPLVGLTQEGESLLLNQPLPSYKSLSNHSLSSHSLSNQTFFTTGVSASCRF